MSRKIFVCGRLGNDFNSYLKLHKTVELEGKLIDWLLDHIANTGYQIRSCIAGRLSATSVSLHQTSINIGLAVLALALVPPPIYFSLFHVFLNIGLFTNTTPTEICQKVPVSDNPLWYPSMVSESSSSLTPLLVILALLL